MYNRVMLCGLLVTLSYRPNDMTDKESERVYAAVYNL